MEALALPPLHVVTDDRTLARPDFERQARAVLEAGAGEAALHLRGPATSGAVLWRLASALVPAARAAGALLVVNDRVDVAAAAGADGVQLGRRSLAVAVVRALPSPPLLVGASVHDAAEADEAAGADWLIAGTIYPSASHRGRPAAGPDLIRGLAPGGRPPVVAIGGVAPDHSGELRRVGAQGVAVLGGIWNDARPARAVASYLEAWHASAPAGATGP